MISFKLFSEAINDKKTSEETADMHKLGKHLEKHYHFGTKSMDLSADRDEYGSPPRTTPPNNSHVENIHAYTQGSLTNRYLWNRHLKKQDINKNAEDITNRLNHSLHFHKTPKDLTVYSSTIHNPEQKKNSEGIMHHPAFISTTIDKDYADSWFNKSYEHNEEGKRIHHILKIHVPKGSPGAYVEHFTAVPGQHEFIIPKGSNLKYHHTEKLISPSKDDVINHYHHVSLEPESK